GYTKKTVRRRKYCPQKDKRQNEMVELRWARCPITHNVRPRMKIRSTPPRPQNARGAAVGIEFLERRLLLAVSFSPAMMLSTAKGARAVAVGDFDGDSVTDLAVANNGSNNISILLGRGDGSFDTA